MIEITEVLDKIAEFMGYFNYRPEVNWWYEDIIDEQGRKVTRIIMGFDPLHSWDDWMLVEQRIRGEGLWEVYVAELIREHWGFDISWDALKDAMSATLEQRASALERVLEERE